MLACCLTGSLPLGSTTICTIHRPPQDANLLQVPNPFLTQSLVTIYRGGNKLERKGRQNETQCTRPAYQAASCCTYNRHQLQPN